MARLLDDASSQYFSRAFGGSWGSLIPISLCCWFYLDDLTISQHLLGLSREHQSSPPLYNDYIRIMFNSAGLVYVQHYTTTSGSDQASIAFNTANEWHFLAGIFRSTSYRALFLDGSSTTANDSGANTAPDLNRQSLGGLVTTDLSLQPLSGRIAEAAMWSNYELSNDDIDMLADGYSPRMVRPQNLGWYWPSLSDKTSLLHDWCSTETAATGEHQDLTPVNGPTNVDHASKMIYPGYMM